MAHVNEFLKNLSLVLGVAAVTTVIFYRLRQPVILGYLLAGVIIGPHIPIPLIADPEMVHTLAELGMVLLMFYLGLEFSLRKLVQAAPTAGFIAILQCSLMIWLGYAVGHLFGWSNLESFYMGAMVAISSTAIIVKAFVEISPEKPLQDIVFSVLIVEDIIAILLLTVLTTVSTEDHFSSLQLLKTAGGLTLFIGVLLIVGLMLVPRLMRRIVQFQRSEITLITSVGLCFSMALLASYFGYSVALGAFVAGALISESGEAHTVEKLVEPVRDIFAAVFFVAVGMLIDPVLIGRYWLEIVIFTGIVVFGKIVGVALGTFLTGHSFRLSVKSGMSLAQIGEFSFIIAGVGITTGATGNFLYPIAVAVCALTTLLTPWLIRYSEPTASWLDQHLPKSLQTFTVLYGSWIEQWRQSQHASLLRHKIQQLTKLLLMDFGVVIGIILGSSLAWQPVKDFLLKIHRLSEPVVQSILVVGMMLVLLPFLLGLLRIIRRLGLMLAYQVMPEVAEKNQLDLADAPRRSLVITLQMMIVLFLGLILLVVIQPFVPLVYTTAAFAALLMALVYSFWRRAESLQGHVKAGAQVILESIVPQYEGNSEPLKQIQTMLPGLGSMTPVLLGPESFATGKTLSQLDLRSKTGATILAITRQGSGMLFPSGKEVLRAGDVLAITGSSDSVRKAKLWIQLQEQ